MVTVKFSGTGKVQQHATVGFPELETPLLEPPLVGVGQQISQRDVDVGTDYPWGQHAPI